MKAIELVKILCDNPELTYELHGDIMKMAVSDEKHLDAYCMGYFGISDEEVKPLPWKGVRKPNKTYFYLYISMERKAEIYNMMEEAPDAFCKRKENDIVALWEIES